MKILLSFVFMISASLGFADSDVASKIPKVLLIGIDGLQYGYINKLPTPNIDKLFIQKAYAGGVAEQQTEQNTFSGPAWATIMTGVWANKHHIRGNNSDLANAQFPSLYRRIYEHNPTALMYGFATWEQTHTRYFKNDLSLLAEESHGGHDVESVGKTLQVLKEKSADFIFLHLDDVDHAGHDYCFSEEYTDAIVKTDERIGDIFNAIEMRQSMEFFKNEDWLILLVTDHGRDKKGCGHGSQTTQEKTVFIAANKPFHQDLTKQVSSANKNFEGIYNAVPQTAIAPTVLKYLGIDIQDEWLFEGSSVLEAQGVRALIEANSPYEFLWYVDGKYVGEGNIVEVWRNNELLAQVPYETGQWRDVRPVQKLNDYQFKFQGVSIAYRVEELSFFEQVERTFDELIEALLKSLEIIFSPLLRLFL